MHHLDGQLGLHGRRRPSRRHRLGRRPHRFRPPSLLYLFDALRRLHHRPAQPEPRPHLLRQIQRHRLRQRLLLGQPLLRQAQSLNARPQHGRRPHQGQRQERQPHHDRPRPRLENQRHLQSLLQHRCRNHRHRPKHHQSANPQRL